MKQAQTFELLTPCFCAGFSKNQPEMRIPSIRGQLRWWARLLNKPGRSEYQNFGGIKGKAFEFTNDAVASAWKLTLQENQNAQPDDRYLVPHKENGRGGAGFLCKALIEGNRYTLGWQPQPHPKFNGHLTSEDARGEFTRILKTWMLLGTVGRRATRAMGSVWPLDYCPTEEEFHDALKKLRLPNELRFQILNKTGAADELTRIAGETVHGLKMGDFTRNPLGFVKGSSRKSSPLRFKVGRFKGGLKLIAIWDARTDRKGDLGEAIGSLTEPLRELMKNFPLL